MPPGKKFFRIDSLWALSIAALKQQSLVPRRPTFHVAESVRGSSFEPRVAELQKHTEVVILMYAYARFEEGKAWVRGKFVKIH